MSGKISFARNGLDFEILNGCMEALVGRIDTESESKMIEQSLSPSFSNDTIDLSGCFVQGVERVGFSV